MKYLWATATHQGMVRQNNEDTIFPDSSGESEGPTVLIVADGMGGHVAGEVASRLAVNAAASSDLEAADRVAAGNRAIREEVAREPSLEGMGTTMTLLSLDPDGTARVGHIGDSRAYLHRSGDLTQLTEDHTVAGELASLGQIEPDEVESHPQRHMLTRTLGLTRFVDVDEVEKALEVGDRILLCSDGLTEMVADNRIGDILSEGTPDDAAWALIEAANSAGGVDNISVVIVDVVE
jgi:serine/threonine protein phosphatase PrpC